MKRKSELVSGQIYHIFNRSIARYEIFNSESEYLRMLELFSYYQSKENKYSFSHFKRQKDLSGNEKIVKKNNKAGEMIVQIIAYCLMPTHYHLILKQNEIKGIEKFIANIQNSYAKYFNSKHERKGPLWEGRFKNVLVETDEQLIHLTRYLHLNPTNSMLVDEPDKWQHSSYKEYLAVAENKYCDFDEILDIKPENYKKFVNSNIEYQQELNKIKHLSLE